MRLSNFIAVNAYNIHRLVLISTVLAAKSFDDEYFEN